jgi:Holliday junction resolvasome RuvABC endonuclease subunit
MAKKNENIGEYMDPLYTNNYGRHAIICEKFMAKPKTKILALDLGMVYGYAYLKGHQVVYGYHDVSPTRYATQISSAFAFSSHIQRIAKELGGSIDAILFEDVRGSKSSYALQTYGMFIGALSIARTLVHCKIVNGYKPGRIKKYAVGTGNANKAQMILAANERFGIHLNPKDDIDGNSADALHLLSLGMEALFNMEPLQNYVKIYTKGKVDVA